MQFDNLTFQGKDAGTRGQNKNISCVNFGLFEV